MPKQKKANVQSLGIASNPETVKEIAEAVTEVTAAPAVPAEEKAPAAEAAVVAAAEKPAAETAEKPRGRKTAAKPAAKAKTKARTKSAAKAEPAEKPAAEKRTYTRRAKKPLSARDICDKVYAMADKRKLSAIEGTVAADIKLWGDFEAHMYVEVKDGKLSVEPYDYLANNFVMAVSVEDALAITSGKLDLLDSIKQGRVYANGDIGKAMQLAALFIK